MKGAVAAFDIVLAEDVEVEFESGFSAASAGQPGSQALHGYFAVEPSAPLAGPSRRIQKWRLHSGCR